MLDNFNLYRNKKGYIVLDSLEKKVIERQTYGSRRNKIWFEIDNEELSLQQSIETAHYDIASYQGVKGILTKRLYSK